MSTFPGASGNGGFSEPPGAGTPKKSNRGKIIAIVGAVVALLLAAGIGRASATQEPVQPAAAPAPVTITAKP